jgi:hypothetical protein
MFPFLMSYAENLFHQIELPPNDCIHQTTFTGKTVYQAQFFPSYHAPLLRNRIRKYFTFSRDRFVETLLPLRRVVPCHGTSPLQCLKIVHWRTNAAGAVQAREKKGLLIDII